VPDWTLAAAVLAAAAGCEETAPPADTCIAAAASAIYGGAPAEPDLDRDAAGAVAAVHLARPDTPGATPIRCSGVLLAGGLVLTARHCFTDCADCAVSVSFGACAGTGPLLAASAVVAHPSLDVAVVRLAATPSSQAPASLATDPPAAGAPAIMAGYGLEPSGGVGQRLYLATTIAEVGADTITVDSGADAGACAGDSGGPLFVTAAAAGCGHAVAGTLSEGSPTCTRSDTFVRASSLSAWIASAAAGP
jgi:hypothetical protein